MKTILCILFATLALVGCGPIKKEPENVVLVPKNEKVNIPQYMLTKCPPLKKIPVREYNQGETVQIMNRLINQSEDCRKKDDLLVDTVKKAFNTEQQTEPSK